MAGFDRSRISLGRRTQQQTDTRDSNGGVGRQGFMDYRSCGLKFFKFGDVGKYHDLNILPWRIGTKNHPEVYAKNAEVGDFDYVLDLMVHTRIGPGNGDYICPKKNFNKPCPICERADELWKNEATKKDAKKLFARRKCVYCVQELNENFKAKSADPMIFEVSHPCFSQELQSRATSCLRGKGVVNFADPDEGKVVSFSVNEGSMGDGKTFKKAGNFEFNERVEEISDETLEKCPSLDSMMVLKSYDQLKAALYGDPDDVEEDFNNQPEADEGEESTPARFRDNNPPARFDDNPSPRRSRAVADETPSRRSREVEADEVPSRRNREAEAEAPAPRRTRAVEAEEPAEETAPRRSREVEAEEPAPRRNRETATEEATTPRRTRTAEAEDSKKDFDVDLSEDPYTTARRTSRRAMDEAPEEKPAPRCSREPVEEKAPAMPFDDEQPEEPAETPTRGDTANSCPFGYEFGVDCESGKLCSKCSDDVFAKCCAAKQNRRGR